MGRDDEEDEDDDLGHDDTLRVLPIKGDFTG